MAKLYYAASNAADAYVIWATDGTAAGTHNIFTGTQTFGVAKPLRLHGDRRRGDFRRP